MPGAGCFLCGGTDHWADNCWTTRPPENRDHHEARIATYRYWFTDLNRVTPYQKAKLIEHENKMWRDMQPKRERKAS